MINMNCKKSGCERLAHWDENSGKVKPSCVCKGRYCGDCCEDKYLKSREKYRQEHEADGMESQKTLSREELEPVIKSFVETLKPDYDVPLEKGMEYAEKWKEGKKPTTFMEIPFSNELNRVFKR